MIEISGRLTGPQGTLVTGGPVDLIFALHPTRDSGESLWEEAIRAVPLDPTGGFWVVLGQRTPIAAEHFGEAPAWVSVRLPGPDNREAGPRIPVTGATLKLDERLETLTQALSLGERVETLETRLDSIQDEVEGSNVEEALKELQRRLTQLDSEEGRLMRIEDELEDLIGPDGDVVDLNERMDRIEGQAPDLIASLRAREAEMSRERLGVMRRDLDQVGLALAELRERLGRLLQVHEELANRPPPTAAAVGAVDRAGDVMTGGLTINRGGLEVISGGISCRGANVNSLEATLQVKAPKVIADAIELRGDLTVDNSHRALQIRMVEGRQGSARKDGALFLNGRSGAEVVVGTAEERRGIQVHGPVTGGAFHAEDTGLAQTFDVYGSIEPGQVACIRPEGGKVEPSRHHADATVIGVCVERAAFSAGGSTVGGRATVVLNGVTRVRARASGVGIQAGTLLVSGADGVAEAAAEGVGPGRVFGKALSALAAGDGEVAVLVGVR